MACAAPSTTIFSVGFQLQQFLNNNLAVPIAQTKARLLQTQIVNQWLDKVAKLEQGVAAKAFAGWGAQFHFLIKHAPTVLHLHVPI